MNEEISKYHYDDELQNQYSIDFSRIDELVEEIKAADRLCIYCDIPFWYELDLVERKLNLMGKEVYHISEYREADKMKVVRNLEENDLLISVFPKWSYYNFLLVLHKFEPNYRQILDDLVCKQYFIGQKIANIIDDSQLIEMPYYSNHIIYRKMIIEMTCYLLSKL